VVVNTEVVIINNVTQVVQIGGDNSTSTLLQREINAFLSSFKVRLCDLALLNSFTPRMRLHIWVTHSTYDMTYPHMSDLLHIWVTYSTYDRTYSPHLLHVWDSTYECVAPHMSDSLHVWHDLLHIWVCNSIYEWLTARMTWLTHPPLTPCMRHHVWVT